MRVEIDNNYGADIDGNRGIKVYEYEIEESDGYEIVKQLREALDEGANADGVFEVSLLCPYTEEMIDIEVTISDYITNLGSI